MLGCVCLTYSCTTAHIYIFYLAKWASFLHVHVDSRTDHTAMSLSNCHVRELPLHLRQSPCQAIRCIGPLQQVTCRSGRCVCSRFIRPPYKNTLSARKPTNEIKKVERRFRVCSNSDEHWRLSTKTAKETAKTASRDDLWIGVKG